MKRNYYLLAIVAIAALFSSCDPLSNTYKELGPTPTLPVKTQTITYTLVPTDYKILPGTVYASSSLNFLTSADANQYVPVILNSKYGTYPDGSTAAITFAVGTPTPVVKLADSVYNATVFGTQPTGLTYTLANPSDYLLLSGNKYADFSVTQVLSWLPSKYPSPLADQLEVLTWIFYPTLAATAPQIYPGLSVSTSGSVTTAVGSFLYHNGAWVQCYHLTPAQYAAVGRGQYNQFTSADDANLITYFNGILKADPSTAAAAVGAVQYVSFNYYATAAKVTSQRVIALAFDGNNWSTANVSVNATLPFSKVNGAWIGDPTVYYTLTKTDTQLIGNPNGTNNQSIGTSAQRANLYQYGDFSGWAITDLDNAMILVLTTNFPNPKVNVPYKVTFLLYTSGKDVSTTYGFTYNGSAWVAAQ